MITACGTAPVDLIGWIARNIWPELPKITAWPDLAVAMQSPAQTDGCPAGLINQLGQSCCQRTGSSNMIMHGIKRQFLALLKVGEGICDQAFCSISFGTRTIGQAKPVA